MKQLGQRSEELTDLLAPVMFLLSLLFVVLLGALIVVWVDIPRFSIVSEAVAMEALDGRLDDPVAAPAAKIGHSIVIVAWVLGFAIVLETLFRHIIHTSGHRPDNIIAQRFHALAICLCPPLRLAAPAAEKQGRIWLPRIGWQSPGRKLFRRLEAVFSKPMLFIALLILPVLLVEFTLHGFMERHLGLRLTMHICTGLIWCAFALEFLILFSASASKIRFVKKHWIDLAIVVLPVIMFLRSLRAMKIMKVAKVANAHQLVNLTRVYRVRGVAMKAFRALMLLEVFGRLVPVSPERKLARLQLEYEEKVEELEELKTEMRRVEEEFRRQRESATRPDKPVPGTAATKKSPVEPTA